MVSKTFAIGFYPKKPRNFSKGAVHIYMRITVDCIALDIFVTYLPSIRQLVVGCPLPPGTYRLVLIIEAASAVANHLAFGKPGNPQ